jgi:hypothetical protein
MITIKCNQEIFRNIDRCIKHGKCPEDKEYINNYCNDVCIYNFNNIDFIAVDDGFITIIGSNSSDIKNCIKDTLYNYPKCGEDKDCEECPYYYKNIKFINSDD